MPDYYCKLCLAEATVRDGVVYRTCEHDNETVIAERSVVLFGDGRVNDLSLMARAMAALTSLIKNFRGA